jgi:hypothetical protein
VAAAPAGGGGQRGRPELRLLVGPTPIGVARARWLARAIGRAAGLRVRVQVLGWDRIWAALADPDAGDLLWCGIGAERDRPRDWLRYNLFSGQFGLPPEVAARRPEVLRAGETELVRIDRELAADGWVLPLYKHRQCYLIRGGLEGLQIEPTGWPLPGVRRIDQVRWSPSGT